MADPFVQGLERLVVFHYHHTSTTFSGREWGVWSLDRRKMVEWCVDEAEARMYVLLHGVEVEALTG